MALRQTATLFAVLLVATIGWGGVVWSDEAANAEILRLTNARQFDDARILAQAQNPSPAEAAFLEGRILKVEGRLDEAIVAFRSSLALDPNNLAARRELAHTLLLNRQFDVAQFHFEALLDTDPNTALHEGYRQFLQMIRQNKPVGASGYFAFVPSSNINRGTNNTVFDTDSGTFVIDPDSKAASGIGLQLGVSGFTRYSPSPDSSVIASVSLTGTGYEASIHNWATAAISLTYGRTFENGRWSVGPYVNVGWREDDADLTAVGLRGGVDYRLSPQVSLALSGNHEERRYANQPYNDGPFDQLSFSLAYQFDPTFVLRGTLTGEQNRPNALYQQYDGYSLGASASKVWDGGLATSLSLEWGQRDYIGNYPLTAAPRDDEFVEISMSVQNPQINWNGFTPRLTCSYTANRSSVAFYDYDIQECQATLSTEF